MTDAVIFKNVDIIFGKNPQIATQMVDQARRGTRSVLPPGWSWGSPALR